VKPLAVVAALLASAAATAGLLLLAGRGPAGAPAASAPPSPRPPPASAEPAPPPPAIRPYVTTATLVEDLRDALAWNSPEIGAEWRRVSAAIAPAARFALESLAPAESGERVRALLVLAAGVHVPEDPSLHAHLADRSAIVRRAVAAACAYDPEGVEAVALFGGLRVPVGPPRGEGAAEAVRRSLGSEDEEGVRGPLAAALNRRR